MSLPAGASVPSGVTVNFWAAAREAAGCSSTTVSAGSCAEVVSLLSADGDRLARVVAMSSLLVDGRRVAATDTSPLPAGSVVEVLPPFAGG